jgi:hypothetical protein
MTLETKHLIEIGDIVSIEFTCKKCTSTLLYSIAQFGRVPTQCPNCKEDIVEHLGPDYVAIEEAIKAIKRLKDRHIPVRLRFEIIGVKIDETVNGNLK